ncbi:piggyBac transposable element-derived protein 4-like [Ischnura elegans]|uniref:piggyBac transposable element-derived protein 4-like n=1 Tax=Ischnura elegans TaxID=197161 RepID=UPI001ED8B120|nr:piggyBac transposable element-derived protein 4-like [Ischnura elegans]
MSKQSIVQIVTISDSEDEDLFSDSESDISETETELSDDVEHELLPSTSKASSDARFPAGIYSSESDSSAREEEGSSPKRRRIATNGISWSSDDLSPKNHYFDPSHSGCNADVSESSTVREFFEIFFSDPLIELITQETNKFYKSTLDDACEAVKARLDGWKDVTKEEMYCFLAITLLMTRTKKLAICEYWSKDSLIRTPIFGDLMPRDRYLMILRMLHFSDSAKANNSDRLTKVRPVIDLLRSAYRNALTPFANLRINESRQLFNGRLSFKQYIPSKSSRFGIKTFVLCDCKTGYVLDFIVYMRSSIDKLEQNTGLGKSGDIVSTLMKPYLGKGHNLYVNYCYTSPLLFLWLHRNGTNACGTVRKNRKEMPRMEKRLGKGQVQYKSAKHLLALRWCDKRETWMLSTMHTAELLESNKRDHKTGRLIIKPKCIIDYNASMGAVARADMVTSSVETVRKSVKWYKKIFFHMVDISVLNAHCLYKAVTKKKIPFEKFQLSLIREILETYHRQSRSVSGRRSQHDLPARLTDRHFPSSTCNPATLKAHSRRCVVCSKSGRRRESRYMCDICNVGLCVTPCFQIFHTQKHY